MAMIHAIMGEDTKVLTKEEELQSFFAEQYKKLIKNDEQLSWDTPYRAELNTVTGTEIMKEAMNIHLRSKIRRRTSLDREGVLVFAKKGNDFVFKMAETHNGVLYTPQDIDAEEAFRLLKTNSEEKPYQLTDTFEKTYENVRKSLFAEDSESENEKLKREVLDKIRKMIQNKSCPPDYLNDLKTAIEYDAISGFHLRSINRLKPKEYTGLPNIVHNDYIQNSLQTYDSIGQGKRTLILAEEIESDVVPSTDELKFE